MLKIKRLIASSLMVLLLVFNMAPVVASAQTSELKQGADNAAGSNGADPNSINTTITKVINILSSLVGVAAVIMLIVGGFRYVTSAGNSEAVGKAKNTIIYALIGIVVAALAQIIVQFVLNESV